MTIKAFVEFGETIILVLTDNPYVNGEVGQAISDIFELTVLIDGSIFELFDAFFQKCDGG